DLADTSHTLMIEATGRKNVASNFAFVLVDAFDVSAATISRLQDTDPSVTFTGSGWLQGVTGPEWSGGTAAGSLTAGDQATFTFTGTGVRWLGDRGPQTGIARVILDGTVVADSLDMYISGDGPQEAVFTLPGLAAVSHTLTIEVTGLKNPASAGTAIVVVAFDVTP